MKREGSVDELAEALEASKSGFYAHLRKSEGLRHRADQRVRPLIRSSFERSRATYGCLRIRWDLRTAKSVLQLAGRLGVLHPLFYALPIGETRKRERQTPRSSVFLTRILIAARLEPVDIHRDKAHVIVELLRG
jgi:hypothetical protein